ncbi:MAG: hypothetical protein QOE93_1108, partial [Actinomycetota bacterium]|nr:hypothetical protein [Actinomycetota bacterium]
MMKRRTKLTQVLVGTAALVLLAASASAALVRLTGTDPANADELLVKARAYVADQGTVRTRGETRTEVNFGGFSEEDVPPEESTTIVSRAVVEGVEAVPDRSRSISRSSGAVTETIVIGDTGWGRFAENRDDLGDELWIEIDFDAELGQDPGGGFFGDPTGSSALNVFGGLRDLSRLIPLIDSTVAPTIVSRSGGETVVRAGIDPGVAEGSSDVELRQGSVELTIAKDGRPVRSVVETTVELVGGFFEESGGDSRVLFRVEQNYSGWGEPVDIEPPADSNIDRTPGIEEEAIGTYTDAPLYQPRGLPEDWVLDYADLIPEDESDSGCDEVEIDYTDPTDDTYGYLYLYQVATDCADVTPPDDAVPFATGPYRGWIET